MTALPNPLRRALQEPFTDASLAPLWPQIERRRQSLRWQSRAWLAGGALGVALALFILRLPTSTPGPLHLQGGGSVVAVTAGPDGRVLTLDDRSRVTLSAGARWVPSGNSGSQFASMLLSGTARYDVTPGGPRRWSVACGVATVRVTGTSFTLERSEGGLSVRVWHGRVTVEGPTVPSGRLALGAGEVLVVRAPAPAAVAMAAVVTERVVPLPEPVVAVPLETTPRAPRRGALAREGAPEDLLAQAEAAREARRYPAAAALYQRFLARRPTDAQTPVVAFTLGRLQAERLGDPRGAARSFATALSLGVPRDLEEDLRVRRVQALAQTGDEAGARRAARECLARFPHGRRVGDLRRWSE